jgi:hypothetical protein
MKRETKPTKRTQPSENTAKVLAGELQYFLQDPAWTELLLKCAIASNAGLEVTDLLDDRLSRAQWRRVKKSVTNIQERLAKGQLW